MSALDTPITVTLFTDQTGQEKREHTLPLRKLGELVRTQTAPAKDALPWLKCAAFGDARTDKGSLRHNANMLAVRGIEGDYDGKQVTPEEAADKLRAAGIAALVYTSPSHRDDAPKWRVLCPLSAATAPEERARHVARVNGVLGGVLAAESFTASQSYYAGSVNGNPAHRVLYVEGDCVDLRDGLDATAIGRPGGTKMELPSLPQGLEPDATALAALETSCELFVERAGDPGGRHGILLAASMHVAQFVKSGHLGFEDTVDALTDAMIEDGRDPNPGEVEAALQGAVKKVDAYEPPRSFEEVAAMFAAHALPDTAAPTHMADGRKRKLHRVAFDKITTILSGNGSLVKGVLDAGTMSVVYGASNVGKSFWTLDLCFHVATGRAWRGRLIKKQGCIVYVAAEGGKGFHNRVAALKQHFNPSGKVPLDIIPCPVDLTKDGADVPELLLNIREAGEAAGMPVVMVVIDTLSRAMQGADENSPVDMTAFVGNIDRLRSADPAPHVLVVHHTGKDAAKGSRGHSSLRAATDTEIELVRKGEGADKSSVANVKKQRDMPGEEVFPFTLATVELGRDEDGEAVTSAVIEPLAELPGKAADADLWPRALRSLRSAITEVMGPDGIAGREAVREAFYARHEADGDTLEKRTTAKRVAFHRAMKAAREADLIVTREGQDDALVAFKGGENALEQATVTGVTPVTSNACNAARARYMRYGGLLRPRNVTARGDGPVNDDVTPHANKDEADPAALYATVMAQRTPRPGAPVPAGFDLSRWTPEQEAAALADALS